MLRLLVVLTFFVPLSTGATKPNVIVFLSDDQGWGDLSHSGNKDVKTPKTKASAEKKEHSGGEFYDFNH